MSNKPYVLHQGDCLEVMPTLAPASIDLVLCDLPYGTTQNPWDRPLDLQKFWECVWQVRKPGAAILLFGSEPYSSKQRLSNEGEYRYDWIWDKGKGSNPLLANKQPMKTHEIVSVFYDTLPVYNPILREAPKSNASNRGVITHAANRNTGSVLSEEHRVIDQYMRYPTSIIPCCKAYIAQQGAGVTHPTEKPVRLLDYLIRTYTNRGDTVLDATMGSGSTGVAAMACGRGFVGIELMEVYYSMACGRVQGAQQGLC